MDPDLTSEQELLRSTAAKFIEAVCPLTVVRSWAEGQLAASPEYRRTAAELGWYAMFVPEEFGGGGVSDEACVDAALIAEQRGRGLQPGPYASMHAVAYALAAAGNDNLRAAVLPSLASGEQVATWVIADALGAWTPGAAAIATPSGDGYLLSGTAGVVQDAAAADWMLVTASTLDGLGQFILAAGTPGIAIEPMHAHDLTQRFAWVRFDEVRAAPASFVGEPGGSASLVDAQLQIACVLTLAETVGAMDALFATTCAYARDRIAFGRPIGSFQAVKHQLADISLSLESSRAIVAAAVNAVQSADEHAAEIVSIAKSWVGDAGIDLAQGCFQIFAGIAYSWEHDFHLFLRRITMNSLLFGQPDWHRERICQLRGI